MNKLITFLLWLAPAVCCADMSCHLHPPDVNQRNEQSRRLIGPFATQQQCENENELRYHLRGRCHCSFANSRPFMPDFSEPERGRNSLP